MGNSFKYYSIETIYLFFVILCLGRPATIFSNFDPRTNLIGLILYLVPCLYFIFKYGIHFNRGFILSIAVYTIWGCIHFYLDTELKFLPYLMMYVHLLVAYILIQVFHTELFSYFWRIATIITAVDLVLWGLVHFIPASTLTQFSLLTPASSTSCASFVFFNVSDPTIYEGLGLFSLMRNCGFAWEPGLYGSILVLAIFFNLAERKYQIKTNYALFILVAGVFTSFSTTAYSALLLLFALHLLFTVRSNLSIKHIIGILLLVGSAFTVNNLPFMREKIKEDISLGTSYAETQSRNVKNIEKGETQITLKRTEGILLDYVNFSQTPVWGYGFNRENSFAYKHISPYIVTSNDLTSFLAKWGIIYTLLIVLCLIWSSYFLRNTILIAENSILLLYLAIAVSYCSHNCAMIIAMLLYRVFEVSPEETIQNDDEEYEVPTTIQHYYDML